jgi:hypothetical protein
MSVQNGEPAADRNSLRRIRCRRCGGLAHLETVLGRFGEQPAYMVFHCDVCNFTDWTAIKDPDQVRPA